jgi:hypothetical protein
MTQKIFFPKNFDMGIKNAEFDAKFKSVKKVAKSLHEESYRSRNGTLVHSTEK